MKILYDHQTFSGSKYGGVARYFYDLIRTLKNHPHISTKLALKYSNSDYLKDGTLGHFKPYMPLPIIGKKHTIGIVSHFNRAYSAYNLLQKEYDIFHPTFYNGYFLPFVGKKPFVITYHDLVSEIFSDKWEALDGFNKDQKENILKKAAKIIAVSENTKQDLIDVFNIAPEKISVIHHGTHFDTYKPASNFNIATPESYLLYVGNRDYYKNFKSFIRKLSPLLHKYKGLHLICAGGGAFNATEINILNEAKIQNQVLYKAIESDDTLYRLYEKALTFVYPSLYEGFGIPILEAFACGCPVVLANRSSFPEVGQDAALYFNPDSAEEMNHQIETLIIDSTLRTNMIKKGYERLKSFSLAKMGQQTSNVYKEIG